MSNGNTVKERLTKIETEMKYMNTWMKGMIVAVLGSLGINIII